jgi:hypothetical protein
MSVGKAGRRPFRGDLAAVSVQNCVEDAFRGFALYDVSDPTDPQRLALHETPNTGGSHEIWLKRVGRKAYVYTAIILSELTTSPDFDPEQLTASTPGEPDFRIIDVSDPRNPVKVGEWGAWAELGVHPLAGQGAVPESFVHSVITNRAGTKAFLSYWDLGTVILDISDPTPPAKLPRPHRVRAARGGQCSLGLARQRRGSSDPDRRGLRPGAVGRHRAVVGVSALLRHLQPGQPGPALDVQAAEHDRAAAAGAGRLHGP